MTRATKKEWERAHLQCFLSLRSATPPIQIEAREEPDFLLRFPNEGKIGVEVTELFCSHEAGGESLQAQEALRRRVVDKALARYCEQRMPQVQVSVFFDDSLVLRKNEVYDLAEKLVGLVQINMPPEDEHREEEYTWLNREYFPEEFRAISVYRLPESDNFWRHLGGTYVPTLRLEDVQRVVDVKETRSSKYRESCSQIWLLLIADGFEIAKIVNFDEDVYRKLMRRSFDRVFLLHNRIDLRELPQTINQDA